MTRNPYRTALGAVGAAALALGAGIWLIASAALGGNYPGDPGWAAGRDLGGILMLVGIAAVLLWLGVCAVGYRAPAESALEAPRPQHADAR